MNVRSITFNSMEELRNFVLTAITMYVHLQDVGLQEPTKQFRFTNSSCSQDTNETERRRGTWILRSLKSSPLTISAAIPSCCLGDHKGTGRSSLSAGREAKPRHARLVSSTIPCTSLYIPRGTQQDTTSFVHCSHYD